MRTATVLTGFLLLLSPAPGVMAQRPVAAVTAPATPAVAVAGDTGDFIVVWTDVDESGKPSSGVFARLFERSGKPKGGAFRVHDDPTGDQIQPKVAADERGNFVVVWQGGTFTRGTNVWPGGDGDGMGVFAQRFDRNGKRLGAPLRASRAIAGSQILPNVAIGSDGSFLVVWEDCLRLNDCPTLRVGRFSAGGKRSGKELEIPVPRNVGISGPSPIPTPHIAIEPGGFAVGWTEFEACYKWYTEAYPVVAHFTASGRPVGERFRLEDGDCDDATGWRLAGLTTDREGSSAAFFNGLRSSFQLFAPTGIPRGRRKVISCGSPCDGQIAGAAMDADGGFAVIWDVHKITGDPVDPDQYSVLAQLYNSAGRPLGDRVEVASATEYLFTPVAAFAENGTLIVVWVELTSSNGGASFEQRLLFRQIRPPAR